MRSPLCLALAVLLAACAGGGEPAEPMTPPPAEIEGPAEAASTELGGEATDADVTGSPPEPSEDTLTADGDASAGVTAPDGPHARPDWLGTRSLPVGANGFAAAQPTPPELEDRRLVPPDEPLPRPADDAFAATIAAAPDDVLTRSTWHDGCPVTPEDLRYVTASFWGFDGVHRTGELLVHADAAEAIVGVHGALHADRFPIEELRIIAAEELDLPPTGDGNVSTAFVCRDGRSTGAWSQHAYGLAVDINPFHNPYLKGDVVLPELATSYVDRDRDRPGMIQPGDVVTRAFSDIGWGWGGDWSSLKDWMHFSADGR